MLNTIIQGDSCKVLKTLPDASVDCVVTSPPYFNLRDYGHKDQIGIESTFDEYLDRMMEVFDEVYRVLKKDGCCFVNLGDTYFGTGFGSGKAKNFRHERESVKASRLKMQKEMKYPQGSLCMIPARFAIKMVDRGWILRNDLIWWKPNAMPQSMKNRFTVDYENIFFFVKNQKYFFNQQFEPYCANSDISYRQQLREANADKYSMKQPYEKNFPRTFYAKGRNMRSIWKVPTKAFNGAHYAAYPEELVRIPIDAGCRQGGVVLDPFMGKGTTAKVAREMGRNFIGVELNQEYIDIANKILAQEALPLQAN